MREDRRKDKCYDIVVMQVSNNDESVFGIPDIYLIEVLMISMPVSRDIKPTRIWVFDLFSLSFSSD